MITKYLACKGIKKMPSTHKIQRRVGRAEAAYIENPRQSSVRRDENVPRNQVAVTGHIGTGAARQFTHLGPHPAQSRYIKQSFASLETDTHPPIVGIEHPAPTRAIEHLPIGRDRAHVGDELRQILRESLRISRITIGRHGTRQPGLHGPRQPIARSRSTNSYGLRGWKPVVPKQFRRRIHLSMYLPQHCVAIFTLQRKSRREPITDTKDRVNRSRTRHTRDRQSPPLRELIIDQSSHYR